MHYATVVIGIASLLELAIAHPGHGKLWTKRLAEIKERAARPPDSPNNSDELLGDLVKPGPSTQVGRDVAGILTGKVDSQSTERINGPVAKLGSPECAKDKCCVWKYMADEMAAKFKGESGRCNNFARASVRLSFHDAGTWQKGNAFGGADGSMILTNEVSRPINRGLEEVVDAMKGIYAKYKQYGVSAADLIQTGGTVATVVCPLGPRIRTFIGRKDNPTLPPDGLLPEVTDSADSMIAMFERKTIKAHGLAALVGAHTTSQQRFFDRARALDPQDSTPGVWDVAFYPQTLAKNPPRRVLKFPSDVVLSTHPKVADEWREFAGPGGQEHWNDDFAKEMVRMGLLGVNNINDMTECTKVLPPHTDRVFNAPDRPQIAKWSNGGYSKAGRKFGELVSVGMAETNQTLMQNGIDIDDGGPLPPSEFNPAAMGRPDPPQTPNNAPPNGQPRAGQPPNNQPGNRSPSGQPPKGQPPTDPPQNAPALPTGQPRAGQPLNNQPGDRPLNGQPTNGQPPNEQPPNGRPPNGRPPTDQPQNAPATVNGPQNGRPQNGQPPVNQPANGRPGNDQPRNGQNPNAPPANGQPQNGRPQNGRPQPDPPRNGQPPVGQQPGQPRQPSGNEQQRPPPKEPRPAQNQPDPARPSAPAQPPAQKGQPPSPRPNREQPKAADPRPSAAAPGQQAPKGNVNGNAGQNQVAQTPSPGCQAPTPPAVAPVPPAVAQPSVPAPGIPLAPLPAHAPTVPPPALALPQPQRGRDDRRGGRGRGGDDQARGQAQSVAPYFPGGYFAPPPGQNLGGYI